MKQQAVQGAGANPLGTEPVGKLILKFSIPSVISMLVNALYNIVDQIFIGQGIGMPGNAATNVAFPLTTICTALALLIGIGSASNFNLRLGEGEKEQAGHFAGNGISLSILFGTVLMVVVLAFLQPLLVAFGATELVLPYAEEYTGIVAIGIPFLVFFTAVGHLIRADGSPRYAMACMLSGAIFNIIFDPIFMFVLDMGIAGIAWATTLGQILSSVIAIYYFARKFTSAPLGRRQLKIQGRCLKRIASLGSAACFNQLAMTVVQIVMNNVMTYYGAQSVYGSEIPLAVVGVISKVNILFLSFAIGIAQGCQPINGFNYGAKKYDRVKETYKKSAISILVIGLAAFLCFQIFPRQITAIFGTGSEAYFLFAEKYLRIFMMMTVVNGLQPITANFFTSIGKSKKGIFISLTRQLLFLLPLVLILPMFVGIDGVMYAGPIADGVSVALAILFITREMKELTQKQRELQAPA